MLSLSTKERKAKFNTDDLIFRNESNLTSGTTLSLSSYDDIEYVSAESLANKYKLFGTKSKQTVNFSNIPKKPFPLTSSNKYIMIEEFKDEIKRFKKYIEWDK